MTERDFDLVGIDPGSADSRCPGVWVEPETGDIYFRGKVVHDPLIIARFEADAPSSADEGVFKIPSRMRRMVAEAATGDYDRGRTGHGEISLHDLLKTARHSAIHLETRDTYDPATPAFQEWLGGGSGRSDRSAWTSTVSSMVDRGVRVRRARVISVPVTDYIRWEHMVTDVNIAAGEDVRWLVRDDAPEVPVPAADYWLIDHRLIIFNTCTGDGAHHREHYSNDQDVIARCLLWFEQVWERAVPHAEFQIDDAG